MWIYCVVKPRNIIINIVRHMIKKNANMVNLSVSNYEMLNTKRKKMLYSEGVLPTRRRRSSRSLSPQK